LGNGERHNAVGPQQRQQQSHRSEGAEQFGAETTRHQPSSQNLVSRSNSRGCQTWFHFRQHRTHGVRTRNRRVAGPNVNGRLAAGMLADGQVNNRLRRFADVLICHRVHDSDDGHVRIL
jgi:hypothetical protein